jgi:hypothetical protein
MARFRGVEWSLPGRDSDTKVADENVKQALLMDLRDELRTLNRRFAELPCVVSVLRQTLRQIKLQRRCPAHPRYTGKREPSTDCRPCWRFWRAVWK